MLTRFKTTMAGCSVALMLGPAAAVANEQELSGPMEDVQESAEVLTQMRDLDPQLASRIDAAKGVFVIPDYATASLLVGGSGGEGVLLSQRDGQWGSPGFYDIGNVDLGAQVGAAAGSIVMLLMTDEAVEPFHQENDFALTAQAGLTIVNWSAQAQGNTEDSDIVVWTDTEGLLAEASLGIGGMSWDEEEAREYYQQDVTIDAVLAGDVRDPNQSRLRSEFAEFSGSAATEAHTDSSSSDAYKPETGDYGEKAEEGIDEYRTWSDESEQNDQ